MPGAVCERYEQTVTAIAVLVERTVWGVALAWPLSAPLSPMDRSIALQYLSLLPPLVAILLAFLTRRVVPSLLAGVVVGAALLTPPADNAVEWTGRLLTRVVAQDLKLSVLARDHLMVLAFTLLLGAMVGVMHAGGGMADLVQRMARRAESRRGGQVVTWLLGLVVFFDDYANSLLIGTTMQPVADRLRFSRAKLAYIVDATAAPVAGIALISTWVGGEIAAIADGLAEASAVSAAAAETTAVELFLVSIPYRTYPLLAIALVGIVAMTGRDFGPMLTEERRMRRASLSGGSSIQPSHWSVAVFPVVLTVIAMLIGLYQTGDLPPDAVGWRYVVQRMIDGDSYIALLAGAITGFVTAVGCTLAARSSGASGIARGAFFGAWHVMPAMIVLWLAWAIQAQTTAENLDTGSAISALVSDRVPLWLLPTVTFLVAAVTAFSTGSSWGTFPLITPLVLPLAFAAAEAVGGSDAVGIAPVVLGTVGAVLAGAIFGDHCSPISDTTVLSSRASGCDHLLHVRTQLPYALLGAAVAILCGTLPSGFGVSPLWTLPLGVAGLWIVVRVAGRRAEE